MEIKPEARNWYVPVSAPDTLYFAEIGFFARDGGWVPIVTSGVTKTPPDALAEDAAAEFATVPAHLTFERMLELVRRQMEEGETLLGACRGSRAKGGRSRFAPAKRRLGPRSRERCSPRCSGDSLVDRVGLGSAEIDQLLRKQLLERLHSESASGLVARIERALRSRREQPFQRQSARAGARSRSA